MTTVTAFTDQGKLDMMRGRYDFAAANVNWKAMLIKNAAARTYNRTTTDVTDITQATTDEAALGGGGTGDYATGGTTLTCVDASLNGTGTGVQAITDFNNVTFTLAGGTTPTLSAEGMAIFEDSITTPTADPIVSVHQFATTPTASGIGATFTIQFPAPATGTAIIRLA